MYGFQDLVEIGLTILAVESFVAFVIVIHVIRHWKRNK